jgi:hypothetical protein
MTGALLARYDSAHAHGGQQANVVPAVMEEVECQQCEEAWLATPGAGGVYYYVLHHRFTGSCTSSRGTQISIPAQATKRVNFEPETQPLMNVAEEDSYCARCGGTSTCHQSFETEGCHLRCGAGGGEVSWQAEKKLRMLLRDGQFAVARKFIEASDRLLFNPSTSRVTVLGCEREVFNVVSLTGEVAQALIAAE